VKGETKPRRNTRENVSWTLRYICWIWNGITKRFNFLTRSFNSTACFTNVYVLPIILGLTASHDFLQWNIARWQRIQSQFLFMSCRLLLVTKSSTFWQPQIEKSRALHSQRDGYHKETITVVVNSIVPKDWGPVHIYSAWCLCGGRCHPATYEENIYAVQDF